MANARLQSVDVYRGAALIAMAVYHALWDLNYYRLIELGIGVDPFWIGLQRSIAASFILLAGASLVLAHSEGINWRGFWKREALLVGAAALISIVTWFQFGEALAYFGVLHAIALFSLLALPFVRLPIWVGAAAAAVVLGVSLYNSDVFDPRWLSWLGFFRTTPETADLVPVFPWFGVMLIGVVGMRFWRAAPAFTWTSGNRLPKAVGWLGRWSLLFYLIHQPILFGLIAPIGGWADKAQQEKFTAFTNACMASCGQKNASDPGFCTNYCGCTLEMTVRDNLWNGPETELRQMSELCTALSE